jgi:type I site-specific restriction-modification system R (restriction) subunit
VNIFAIDHSRSDQLNGRPQPVQYIDFDHPSENDLLVINQFKVELTSGARVQGAEPIRLAR